MLPRFLKRSSVLIFAVCLMGWASNSVASPIVGGGIDVGHACLDTAVSCVAEQDFTLAGLAGATGTVDITPLGGISYLFGFDVDVSNLVMQDTAGAIDGVDMILFTNLTFDVAGVGASDFGSGLLLTSVALVTVTGTYEQFLGASSVVGPTFFSQSVSLTSIGCVADGVGNCGWGLDSVGAMPLNLNVGTTGGGTAHDFGFTFNVAIPEPSTATLLGLGLVLVGARRRRS